MSQTPEDSTKQTLPAEAPEPTQPPASEPAASEPAASEPAPDEDIVALVNIAHEGQAIVSETPAIRICGLFRGHDALMSWIGGMTEQERRALNAAQEARCNRWLLIARRREDQLDAKRSAEIVEGHLRTFVEHRQRAQQDLRQTRKVANRTLREANKRVDAVNAAAALGKPVEEADAAADAPEDLPAAAVAKAVKEGDVDEAKLTYGQLQRRARERRAKTESGSVDTSGRVELAPIRASLMVADQRFAIIQILHDLRPEVVSGEAKPEPAVRIMGAVETEDDARRYIEQVTALAPPGTPQPKLYTVNMYEMLHVEDVAIEDVPTAYVNKDELTGIMSEQREQRRILADVRAAGGDESEQSRLNKAMRKLHHADTIADEPDAAAGDDEEAAAQEDAAAAASDAIAAYNRLLGSSA
jgi:hypothetical protein